MKSIKNIESRILWLSFYSGIIFSAIEFIAAIYTGSQSVLMDAAYDSSELIIIGLTLFLVPIYTKPISEKRPFGYAQVESVFILIKSFALLAVTISLTVNSLQVSLSGGRIVNGNQISFFQLILSILSGFILFSMKKMNTQIDSPTIKSEIYGWKMDVFYSLGMSFSFLMSSFLDGGPFAFILPYFDQIVAILIVLFMLPSVIILLLRSIQSIFLFAPHQDIFREIKGLLLPILEESGYESRFFDITQTGRKIWVSVYFDTNEDTIYIADFKICCDRCRLILSENFSDIFCELIPDPKDK